MTDSLGVSREPHERLAQERRRKAVEEWRDISQQETATALGLTLTNYNRYEKGHVRIPDDVIVKAAAHYGVRRGWLRDGELPRQAAPRQQVTDQPPHETPMQAPGSAPVRAKVVGGRSGKHGRAK